MTSEAGAANAGQIRILVIDDDPDLLELLEALLGLANYQITTAANGVDGLAAIRASLPDAVILDINMPGLDGFAVLEDLARSPPPRRPRILVLSARYAPADAERVLSLGANDYLAKPFNNKTLLTHIYRLVEG
jgi:DNA-binding response OmpR family regulator